MSDVPALLFVEPATTLSTFNTLLYGPSGTGKTMAATSAPGPVLVLNSESSSGLAKARSLGRDIREVRFTGQQVLRPFLEYVKTGEARTVVIDTVAKMYAQIIRELSGAKPQIQHYGQANTMIADLVLFLRDQPVNVVLVCHEKVDDNDGERIVRPLTGGQQLPELLMGEVDIVAYTAEIAKTEDSPQRWVGQLAQDKGRRAKDRSGGLGVYRDLDLTEWLSVYRAALMPTDDLPFDTEPAEEPAEDAADLVDVNLLDEAAA